MDYRLDLDTLLLMLGQATGSLSSKFQHIPGVKGRCQISVVLEKGVIKSCVLTLENGREAVSGELAVKLIQQRVIEWQYRENQGAPMWPPKTPPLPSQAMPPRQPPGPGSSFSIPRRTYPISQNEFLGWPRLYRAVYSLIDGKVSVEYLMQLFAREQGEERVREVLLDLHRSGLIIFAEDVSRHSFP